MNEATLTRLFSRKVKNHRQFQSLELTQYFCDLLKRLLRSKVKFWMGMKPSLRGTRGKTVKVERSGNPACFVCSRVHKTRAPLSGNYLVSCSSEQPLVSGCESSRAHPPQLIIFCSLILSVSSCHRQLGPSNTLKLRQRFNSLWGCKHSCVFQKHISVSLDV